MSNLSIDEQNQAQAAHATLVREVFVPVFLEKLASDYNIIPQSDEEVGSLLEIAARLGEAQAQEQVKSASTQSNFLKVASNQLGNLIGSPVEDHTLNSTIKSASYELANRPDLIDAVLTYHGAIAKQMAAQ